jgi:hypothetical protein
VRTRGAWHAKTAGAREAARLMKARKAYLFDVPSLKEMTFVYKTPAAILTLPVEYELKDIELP